MAQVVVPLFPLDHVLMPGCALPLRIFEPRYRQLLADVTAAGADRRFGVVGQFDRREVAPVGTMAEILEVEDYPDGTSAVLTVGSSRFAIDERPAGDKPYETARVRMLDEPVGDLPAGLVESTRADALAYARLLARVSRADVEIEPYPREVVALSYRLANDAPLPRADRQQLLELETAAQRLSAVARILHREFILLQQTRTVAVSPGVLLEVLRLN